MYIKSITICGFKSYKKKVHLELSRGHNVVVGSNGSGKSNIYAALEFVLSSKYDLLRQEQRRQLLHEAGTSGVYQAYVEIVFDNTDKRFPINEPLVSIKRSIGAKKDEYFINQTHTDKKDLNNFLESAGISKQNQHFIVPQGQISKRVQERDNERLQLIKEIAGTRVYDSKRTESSDLLNDADNKRGKVKQVIDYFGARLDELKLEKEELSKFEYFDKQRRGVEYEIYQREMNQTSKKLEKLQENEGQTDQKNDELHKNLKKIRIDIKQFLDEQDEIIKKLEKVNKTLKQKRKNLQNMQRLIITLETKKKKSLQDDNKNYKGKTEKYEKELNDLKKRIETEKQNLNKVKINFETEKKKDNDLRNKKNENDAIIRDLYGKQERLKQFLTKTDRNKDLDKQIKSVKDEIKAQEKLCQAITKENKKIDDKIKKLADDRKKHENLQKNTEKKHNKCEKDKQDLKKQRQKYQNDRKILWKDQNDCDKKQSEYKIKREQFDKDFRHTMSWNMYTSYIALKRIQKDIEDKGHESKYKLSGRLYGPVIENFIITKDKHGDDDDDDDDEDEDKDDDNAEKYGIAVEAAAGNKLFYYIVENDQVATELIEIMKREKINRVTFIPLNQCGPDRQREREYTNALDAIPIINILKWDENIENMKGALLQIFGNSLIAKDLETGFNVATRENFQCVTLNGDIVTSGGAMDGGFNENKYRRLKCYKAINDLDKEHKENKNELIEIKDKLNRLNSKLLDIDNKFRNNNNDINKQRDDLLEIKNKLIEIEERMEDEERLKSDKLELLESHEVQISLLQTRIKNLEKEKKQPLRNQLSNNEQENLTNLQEENENITQELKEAVERINDIEIEMKNIESLLRDNLYEQQKELLNKIKKCNQSENVEQLLDTTNNKLQIETESKEKLQTEIKEDDNNVNLWNSRAKQLEKQLGKLTEREQNLLLEIEEHSVDSEKLVGKRQALQEKKEQLTKLIHDLGALDIPNQDGDDDDDNDQEALGNKSMNQLNRDLKRIKKELEKYKTVNKKARDQYNTFLKERTKLNSRNEKQLIDKEHITELMEHLDNKKDDAIQKTFMGINAKFKESFKQLVSRGSGKLMLFKHDGNNNNNNNDNEDDEDDDFTQTQQSQRLSQVRGGRQRRRRRSSNLSGSRSRQRNRRKSSMQSASQQFYSDELDDKKYAGVGIRVDFGDRKIDDEEEEEVGEEERALNMRQLSGGQQTVVALALIFAIQECDPSPFYVFDEIDAALDQQYRKAVADIIASRKEETQFITTTFRREILQEADKCFVVDFKNKISTVKEVDPNEVDITQFT